MADVITQAPTRTEQEAVDQAQADFEAHKGRILLVRCFTALDKKEDTKYEVTLRTPLPFTVVGESCAPRVMDGIVDTWYSIEPILPNAPEIVGLEAFEVDGCSRAYETEDGDFLYQNDWIRARENEDGVLEYDGAFPESEKTFAGYNYEDHRSIVG